MSNDDRIAIYKLVQMLGDPSNLGPRITKDVLLEWKRVCVDAGVSMDDPEERFKKIADQCRRDLQRDYDSQSK